MLGKLIKMMRRERRHELQHNELADWISGWLERLAPHARLIAAVAVLGVLVAVLVYVLNNRSREYREQAWSALFQAMDAGTTTDLEAVAESYGGSEPAAWARLMAADIHLSNGCQQITVNKADAAQELRQALDGYLALRETNRNPEVQARALWGLARAYEAMAATREGQGQLDKAVAAYTDLAEQWPDSPFAEQAARRAAQLQRRDTRQFLDFLAAYEPAPEAGTDPASAFDFDSLDTSTLPGDTTIPDFSPQFGKEGGLPAPETPGQGAAPPSGTPGTDTTPFGTPLDGGTGSDLGEVPEVPETPDPPAAQPDDSTPETQPAETAPQDANGNTSATDAAAADSEEDEAEEPAAEEPIDQ